VKRILRGALGGLVRMLVVANGLAMVVVAGVLIVTPGISRAVGIAATVLGAQLVAGLFWDWVKTGSRYPKIAATVRPGDRLVVSIAGPMTPDELQGLANQLEERLGVKVTLLSGDVTGMAVKR